MFAEAFPNIANSPSLVWVVASICLHIVNTFIGLTMAFHKSTPVPGADAPGFYCCILLCLSMYLVLNGVHGENTIFDYGVGLYFITILPLSVKWDNLVHGLVAVVGLTLLPVLILLQI